METPESILKSLIKFKRVSEGEYRFENDMFVISISKLITRYSGTNKTEWFADVSKIYKDGNKLFREPYNHIMPTSSLREMKLSVTYFLLHELNEQLDKLKK